MKKKLVALALVLFFAGGVLFVPARLAAMQVQHCFCTAGCLFGDCFCSSTNVANGSVYCNCSCSWGGASCSCGFDDP